MTALTHRQAHALLHFTVLLWGATAIIGKSVAIAALPLVFYRVVIVALVTVPIVALRRTGFAISRRQLAELSAIGVIVAAHWVLFYASVKYAGVAVGVLCLSTITFFTALIEPLLFARSLRVRELVIGSLVVIGVVLLLRFEVNADPIGYVMGIGSALCASLFGTWNGLVTRREQPERVTMYELTAASIACAAAFAVGGGFVAPWQVSATDWVLIGVLAIGCTLLPWLWSLRVLRTLAPYTVALSVSLEPVYSMIFAAALWPESEQLTVRFYIGAGLLIALVVINAVSSAVRSSAVPPTRSE